MAVQDKTTSALRVAKMYYYHNMTTEAIARELNISRSTVSRLLSFAHEQGFVEIRINDPIDHLLRVEESLRASTGLTQVHVVPMSEKTHPAERLERVAQYCASYLNRLFESEMILGIAWGTTTTAISRYLVPKTTHHSQIIQLNGAGNLESMGIEYASEIILRFAENFHASYHLFPVPAFFDNPRTRKALWEETSIQKLLGLQAKADLLLFSIGAVNAGVPSHIHTEGYLQDKDYADLKRWGVAGDIASRFFREDGSDESVLINQRSSGPPLSQIRQKHGICVIAGEEKLKGLRAALKGRLLKELIIDEPSARAFVERFSNGQ